MFTIACILHIRNFQFRLRNFLPYKQSEFPVPYSQIPALLKTGSSIVMYMIVRLTMEMKFPLLFTVRNLNQFHALCGIVKLHFKKCHLMFSLAVQILVKN
jgi:hypothetical protein